MDSAGIILSEITQTERQMLYDITYMWSLKKYNKLVDITKKKQTWIQKTNEWLPVCGGGGGGGVRDQEV